MKSWQYILFSVLNVVLAVYLVLAVTAFNTPDKSAERCENIEINITEGNTNGFLTEKNILSMLQQHNISPLGNVPDSINIREVEKLLKASPLVKEAEASVTAEGNLIIDVEQRLPIIRVKTYNDDYYIDESGNIMPPTPYNVDVIVATGYISKNYARQYLFPLATTINEDELWQQQIEQINILANRGVELVPRVGNHIIYIGHLPANNGEENNIATFITKKLDRLEKFYKYGLARIGWEKFNYINIEYDNQIICKK